jgi:hypothetical protein
LKREEPSVAKKEAKIHHAALNFKQYVVQKEKIIIHHVTAIFEKTSHLKLFFFLIIKENLL